MKYKPISIDISGSANLDISEVWPDGDAPTNPTVEDVIKVIKSDSSSIGELLSWWSIEDYFDVVVCVGNESKKLKY